MKICKKYFFYTIFFILIITSFCSAQVGAVQKGSLEYFSDRFDYSMLNPEALNEEGDIFFDRAFSAENKNAKEKALRYAMRKYYLATKADFKNIYAYVQMGRIYDNLKRDKFAKEQFFKATNLDYYNPYANFYFADYYIKRNDYNRALRHYLLSYQNGYENNLELNYLLAMLYEKLGDLENAKNFYTVSSQINPEKALEIQQKLEQIESLNYDESEYYYIIRE